MLRAYQFKWYFIVTGILAMVGLLSTLLRHNNTVEIKWWEYPEYVLQIALSLLICWLIHGFFLLHKLPWLNNYAKHFLSNLLATISAIILTGVLYACLPRTTLFENGVGFKTFSDFLVHFLGAFLASIISYVVFYSIHTNNALQNSKLENEILARAHLRAQLLSLQQQISPHFLFNSLSTLKTIAPDQATKNYIVQLATVYRYVLNFNEHYLTPLKDELVFIKSYLYIMDQRFEETLQVTIDVPDGDLTLLIPPLSLQLLLENAIKHNIISPDQPLHISIRTDHSPALIVTNNLQLKKTPEEGTGTGLKNIFDRYKLLIDRPMKISDSAGYFEVTLPLLKP
ncbi:sensor histidine kinase [Mucilaginibacter paludis]|uniref:Signal transduction histidine kinase n=1 Tax=Mucilaginibacter paludis DSM 18603 TaxID=714943 RepID=H1Y136_9SPHI|nr:histidine kinase [Mucilaginibacter paludis]EHQ29671.1 putative signal transduction histidine kinase [Mucilaginibacter paludis DSM 18603]